MEIMVGVSNHHAHVTQEDLEILFGKGYELEVAKELKQPGQFASTAIVSIKTEKTTLGKFRILGPCRDYTQVEVLESDKEYFGINPPVRNSGDLEGSETITIIGPKGEITKENSCIIANRHIHINTRDANYFKEDEIFSVKYNNLILNNVHIKIGDNYALAFHINKDDAINNNIENGGIVILRKE